MFKPHADGIIVDSQNGTESRWTFLVQLNSSYSGGSTIFYPSSTNIIKLEPKVGQAVVFHHRVKHEGSEVLAGTKYVLRADVMFQK
jgi:prolyl 4-hydroxylase